jgi:trans-2,3-dihydro-3-hydroxyanthranilate isomerase
MSGLAWVDVFASEAMTGNPLAVVLDADGWPASRMQAFAAELGISETTFVLAPEEEGDYRVRIFTPVMELPMAGDPIVGTAWVLRVAGRIGERARLETGAGTLGVRVLGSVATMEQATPIAGALVDAQEAARAVGIEGAAGPPAQIWSTGVPQLMLATDLESLETARPDHDAVSRLGERDGWIGVSIFALVEGTDDRLVVRVRHFAPQEGIAEDPVTGSAAGALGACLAAAGLADAEGRLEMVVSQGVAGGRGGEVAVHVRSRDGVPQRVQVGGRVVPLFEGHVLDP